MADNLTVDNGTLTDYTVRSTDLGSGVQVQHVRPDLWAPYIREVDEGATYTYVGYAAPGTATSSGAWRIERIVNETGASRMADGNGNFDNVWNNRESLSYS